MNAFLFNYCFHSLKKNKSYQKKFAKTFSSYFLLKSLNINSFLFDSLKYRTDFLLQKNLLARSFNYNFFFCILKFFLTFFLKNVFKHKNITFNFFQKNIYFLNSKAIKKYIRFNMLNSRSKVTQVVKKVFRKTKRKHFILGLKIGFFGRYEKKLRNKSV